MPGTAYPPCGAQPAAQGSIPQPSVTGLHHPPALCDERGRVLFPVSLVGCFYHAGECYVNEGKGRSRAGM